MGYGQSVINSTKRILPDQNDGYTNESTKLFGTRFVVTNQEYTPCEKNKDVFYCVERFPVGNELIPHLVIRYRKGKRPDYICIREEHYNCNGIIEDYEDLKSSGKL